MTRINMTRQLVLLSLAILWTSFAHAQNPTATQAAQLSAFGGLSADFTGLGGGIGGGKNLGLTAGVDLALPPVARTFRPVVEVRGTYPIDSGKIDSQRDILFGARGDFLLGRRIHPYGDFLFGRGQMNYGSGGYLYNNYLYQLTTTWVYSPGAGFDYTLDNHFAIKVDGQFQRWGSAPVNGGTIWSKVGTVGLVYKFDFNRHGIH